MCFSCCNTAVEHQFKLLKNPVRQRGFSLRNFHCVQRRSCCNTRPESNTLQNPCIQAFTKYHFLPRRCNAAVEHQLCFLSSLGRNRARFERKHRCVQRRSLCNTRLESNTLQKLKPLRLTTSVLPSLTLGNHCVVSSAWSYINVFT